MNWLFYILEANLYLILFFAFYMAFLSQETFYRLNRYYLLISSGLAFILPGFKINLLNPIEQLPTYDYQEVSAVDQNSNIGEWLLAIYLIITALGLLKLLRNTLSIFKIVKSSNVRRYKGLKVVIHQKPFSFFNYLFIDPNAAGFRTVLKHEEVHIRQLHSVDITFFELIKIANWFNPFINLIQREIKTLHEYLADEEASKELGAASEYAMLLIQNSNIQLGKTLTNQMFNQSLLKKRIIMLSKKKSSAASGLKYGLTLIMVPAMVCGSSLAFSKNYGYDVLGNSVILQDSVKAREKRVPPPPAVQGVPPGKLRTIADEKLGVPPPPPADPIQAKPKKHFKSDSKKQIPPPTPVEPVKNELPPPPPPAEPNEITKAKSMSSSILSNKTIAFSEKEKSLNARSKATSTKTRALSNKARALRNRAQTLSIKRQPLTPPKDVSRG